MNPCLYSHLYPDTCERECHLQAQYCPACLKYKINQLNGQLSELEQTRASLTAKRELFQRQLALGPPDRRAFIKNRLKKLAFDRQELQSELDRLPPDPQGTPR